MDIESIKLTLENIPSMYSMIVRFSIRANCFGILSPNLLPLPAAGIIT